MSVIEEAGYTGNGKNVWAPHEFLPIQRIATQYRNSPLFQKWVAVFLNQADDICLAICELGAFFDVDIAQGKHLDVLGIIVGQPRSSLDTTVLEIFGFDLSPTTFPYNVGIWTDGQYGTDVFDATDIIYRRMVKARAWKNAAKGTRNDVIRSVEILSERTDFEIFDEGSPMQFGIQFLDSPVAADELTMLTQFDLIARPMGVRLTQVI